MSLFGGFFSPGLYLPGHSDLPNPRG